MQVNHYDVLTENKLATAGANGQAAKFEYDAPGVTKATKKVAGLVTMLC